MQLIFFFKCKAVSADLKFVERTALTMTVVHRPHLTLELTVDEFCVGHILLSEFYLSDEGCHILLSCESCELPGSQTYESQGGALPERPT